MIRKLRLLIAPAILFLATTANAKLCDFSLFDGWFDELDYLRCLCPYVGAEAQLRYMPFNRDRGANVFDKRFPQGNLFLGIKCNDYLGLEAGYEASVKTHRTVNLALGDIGIGTPTQFSEVRNSTAKLYGPHINLLGYWSICDCPHLQLVGTLGLAYLRASLTSNTAMINGNPAEGLNRTLSQTRWIPRVGGGLQHVFKSCIGMRGMIIWENTAQFRHVVVRESGFSPNVYAKLKNSIIFSLGLFFNF